MTQSKTFIYITHGRPAPLLGCIYTVNPLGSEGVLNAWRSFDMPWHLWFFSVAYKKYKRLKSNNTVASTNWATIVDYAQISTLLKTLKTNTGKKKVMFVKCICV